MLTKGRRFMKQRQEKRRYDVMYMNNIFNFNYIQNQAKQQHHQQQIFEVQNSVYKLKDFLDSLDKIDQNYVNYATAEFCAVLYDYAKKHGYMGYN